MSNSSSIDATAPSPLCPMPRLLRIRASARPPDEVGPNDYRACVHMSQGARARVVAAEFHARHYWVEIFDDGSGERLAGPFDPRAPYPSRVSF